MAEEETWEEAPAGADAGDAERCSTAEKALLPVALLLAVLFDRLVAAQGGVEYFKITYGAFFLCYIAAFYLFFWKRLNLFRSAVSWFLGGGAAALCLWNILFCQTSANRDYAIIAMLVIPGVLLVHALWATGAHPLKNPESLASAWIETAVMHALWLFTSTRSLRRAAGSLFDRANAPVVKRALLGLFIAGVLMLVILPLLMKADSVFGYYLSKMALSFDLISLFWHVVVVAFMFGLLYTLLWHIGFGRHKAYCIPESYSINTVTSSVVLVCVISVYALFCLVQFTYLFAGAGLPDGMTYSNYAREGFAQTVAVCTINLLMFGLFLRFVPKSPLRTTLLGLLLALTGIMLFSGAVRLNLYIGAYGMTWLRLLSAWFIIYLAAVIVLCTVPLLRKKQMPVAAICFLMLLGWFAALGYLNPDGFTDWYNAAYFQEWTPARP